jgi:multiple antibiotic resistance protein
MFIPVEPARSFLSSITEFTAVAISSIFFLVDPFGAIPTFMAMTAGTSEQSRRRAARRAALTCFIVLSAFSLAGTWIFKIFGISMPAFQIAGGLILLLIAFEMMQARSTTKEGVSEAEEGSHKEDVGITPLGIPMLAGPGAISTCMVLMGSSRNITHAIPVLLAIAISAWSSYMILSGADRVRKRMGETGIRILMRVMGLMLTAIAIQFVINGLAMLGVVNQQ